MDTKELLIQLLLEKHTQVEKNEAHLGRNRG